MTKTKKPREEQPDLLAGGGEVIEGEVLGRSDVPALATVQPQTLPSTDVILATPSAGNLILLDQEKFDRWEEKLRQENADWTPDVSTDKGRREIASKAYKIRQTKAALDKQGLALTEEARAVVKAVNAGRSVIKDRLDAYADEIRAPLDAWEAAEEARKEANREVVRTIKADAGVRPGETAAEVYDRGVTIHRMTFEAPQWLPEEAEVAEAAKGATVAALVAAHKRLKVEEAEAEERRVREEAERAELEQLRQEKAAREHAPNAVMLMEEDWPELETITPEAVAAVLENAGLPETLAELVRSTAQPLWTARREAMIEEKRRADEQAEADRKAAEERAALALVPLIVETMTLHHRSVEEVPKSLAENALNAGKLPADYVELVQAAAQESWAARRAAIQAAADEAAEEARKEAQAQAEREAEERQREADQKLADAQAEAQKLKDEQAERQRKDDEEAEATRKRNADQDHKRAVMNDAAEALVINGKIGRASANDIVLAIVAGNIPGVSIAF